MPSRHMEASGDALGRLQKSNSPSLTPTSTSIRRLAPFPQCRRALKYPHAFIRVYILPSLSSSGSSFTIAGIRYKPPEYRCVRQLNAWCKTLGSVPIAAAIGPLSLTMCYIAPMREAITYHEVDYDTSARARFKGLPTPESEEAWDSLWQCKEARVSCCGVVLISPSCAVGSLGIPDSKLALLNKSATEKTWHHLPSEAGGGIQAYFEGFHQIHCLVRYRPQQNHRA